MTTQQKRSRQERALARFKVLPQGKHQSPSDYEKYKERKEQELASLKKKVGNHVNVV